MTKRRLNQAAISDIHLFHDRVPTLDICNRLRKLFPANESTAELDIIWIPGDVFHRLQMASSDDVATAKLWICDFLRTCKACDVRVRVMEGTPLHDRNQSKMFETLNISAKIFADVRYIPELSIEHIEDWDLHVLYVPDQHRPDPEDTWKDVQALLASHGLKQVDYALMHGCFEYQLPKIMAHSCHKAKRYLSIVKRWIFNGHHHTHTRFDRIIVQGSTDRLKAGEEEAKGYVRVYEDLTLPPEEATIRFCENVDATPFKEIVLKPDDAQDDASIQAIIKMMDDLPPETRFTIKYVANRHQVALSQFKAFSRQLDNPIKFDHAKSSDLKAVEPTVIEGATNIILTEADIAASLKEQMDRDGLDSDQQARILKQFKEIAHEQSAG